MKRAIAATVVGLGLLGLSIALLVIGEVSEPTFAFLFGASLLTALAIFFSDRIKEIDLRGAKLILQEIRESKAEIEERERKVRKLSELVSDIAAFQAAFHRRLGSKETHKLESQWLRMKVEEVLDLLSLDKDRVDRIFRFLNGTDQMDEMGHQTKASQEVWSDLWSVVERELKDANKSVQQTGAADGPGS